MTATVPMTGDVVDLAQAVCDIESVSGNERALADAVEAQLRAAGHLQVRRDGDTIVAATHLGRSERVIIAGHLDTVPISRVSNNFPSRREVRSDADGEHEWLVGRGAIDMKGGVAVQLALAIELTEPRRDVTWVFYDHEEVEATKNGLGRVVKDHPEWLAGDFAVLGEPTSAGIEGGCNGTVRMAVTTHGVAAHSARAWMGRNAIHGAAEVLARLAGYEAQTITVDGLDYRESLGAVLIDGGTAANIVPDRCTVTVNYRFAPDRGISEAAEQVRALFAGLDVEFDLLDAAPGARPGLDRPLAREFVDAITAHTGGSVQAKYGWTDVARFAELGIPAVNFGPGNALKAHADDEACRTDEIRLCHAALRSWLS